MGRGREVGRVEEGGTRWIGTMMLEREGCLVREDEEEEGVEEDEVEVEGEGEGGEEEEEVEDAEEDEVVGSRLLSFLPSFCFLVQRCNLYPSTSRPVRQGLLHDD